MTVALNIDVMTSLHCMNFFDFARTVHDAQPSPFAMKQDFSAVFEQPKEQQPQKKVTFVAQAPDPKPIDTQNLHSAVQQLDDEISGIRNWLDEAEKTVHQIENEANDVFNEADAFLNSIQ